MEEPRIRHIAINVEDLDKTADFYKRYSAWKNIGGRGEQSIYWMATAISL
jgi:catechol 2,3-dioxygenase-like lactoylglutathione lyase family enzyme